MSAHVCYAGLPDYMPGVYEEDEWEVRTACYVSGTTLRRIFACVGLDMDLYYEGELDSDTCREVAERIQRGEHSLATVYPYPRTGFLGTSDFEFAQDIFCDELSRGGIYWTY